MMFVKHFEGESLSVASDLHKAGIPFATVDATGQVPHSAMGGGCRIFKYTSPKSGKAITQVEICEAYGCDGLHVRSWAYADATNEEALADVRERLAAEAAEKETRLRQRATESLQRSPSQPCPRCGTWCYGDCMAH